MNKITNHMPTEELQAIDAAHHMHPFTANEELREKGVRVVTRARGVFLTDSEGNEILDGMAGLWCVNIGYGREELAEAAARQMRELPYYNTFFQTTHVPAIALAEKLAQLAPGDLNHVFFGTSGSDANDTNVRLVRTYWAAQGKPEKNIIIVSPATLIATLRTVANIWRHEYQNRNALEIAKQGGALYDKFKSFVDDLVKVGQSLKSTQSTYEDAMKKLYSGKDNLIRKTERLKELGAKTSKQMDPKLLDRAEVPQQKSLPIDQTKLFGN